MHLRVLDHLACPVCHGVLALAAPATGVVEEGLLQCAGCGATYPIQNGVPRFVPGAAGVLDETRRTQNVYNFTWRRFGKREVEDAWEKDSYAYDDLIPGGLIGGAGRVGLEAGCGGGADLLRFTSAGATVIGFDLSAGVDVARDLTRDVPTADVVQGDLHHLPFRPETFDFIYSFGVLHHLPDTQAAFTRLAALLKPGAPLVTYLYEDRAERSALDHLLLGAVRQFRRLTSAMSPRLLHAVCWAMVPPVWALCSVPAALARPVSPRLAGAIPFSHTLRPGVLVADLYDRFAPPVEWRFNRDQVGELYARAGFTDVESRQYRGWVSWGFKSRGPA